MVHIETVADMKMDVSCYEPSYNQFPAASSVVKYVFKMINAPSNMQNTLWSDTPEEN